MASLLQTSEAARKELTDRLEAVRRHTDLLESQRRGLLVCAGSLTAASMLLVVEAAVPLPAVVRTAIAGLSVAGLLAPALAYALAPLLRSLGLLRPVGLHVVAQRVGANFPEIRDRLLNALQLGPETAERSWTSPDLSAQAIVDIRDAASGLNFFEAVSRTPLRRATRLFAAAFAVLLLPFLLAPSTMSTAAMRWWHYDRSFVPPPRYVLRVVPGDLEVVKGASVTVRVDVRTLAGAVADPRTEVLLLQRVAGQGSFDRSRLMRDSSGAFMTTLANLRMTTEYGAEADGVVSERYTLTVRDRPVLHSLRVRLDAPAYTLLPARLQDEFAGAVEALPGTRVSVTGEASKPLGSGKLVFGDSTAVPLTLRGERFSGSFTVRNPGTYRIDVRDEQGLANASPLTYPITVLPDAAPAVRIVEPGRNMDIAGNEPIGLIVQAADDYGVSRLRLGYRLSHSKYEEADSLPVFVPLPLPAGHRPEVEVSHLWRLDDLHLAPEDVVEYFVEAFDNDVVNGPKSARTPVYTLRLPSLEEVFTDLDAGHEQRLDELHEALKDARTMREELERMDRDLKTNKEVDWQKQQQAKELLQRAQELQKKVDQVQQQTEAMTKQMEQQRVLSPETMEKYQELQSMFQQMDSKELQDALRQMERSMQSPNRDQLRQALERVQFSEQRLRESIERTIDLLKRLQVEQRMDEVRQRAEDLARRQADLLKDSAAAPADERAARQEELVKSERELEQKSGDLQRRMEEFFTEMPSDKMAKLNEDLQDRKVGDRMSKAAQQMRQGDRTAAQGTQTSVARDLQEFAAQLGQMQQELQRSMGQQAFNGLRRAGRDLLELSRRQEDLKNSTQGSAAGSAQLRENARRQQQVQEDLGNVISGLSELSKRSFVVTPQMGRALGEALANMQSAMRNLENRDGAGAGRDQTAAMAALNRGAQSVQEAMQGMMQGGQGGPGGMGLLQQLQMLAGQQAALNMQVQPGSGAEAARQAGEAARLASEQEALRKSLEQLNREAQSSPDQRRILGDLQNVADEMREVVRQLEQSGITPETVRRQERILSRLLDASRSMRERDYEQKRKAEAGHAVTRPSPGELTPDEMQGRSRLREDLLRALEQGYARDYRELIRRYFESLDQGVAPPPPTR